MSALSRVLSRLPSIGKYILFLILALNAHSLPFVWHLRFWWRLGPRYLLIKARGRQAYIDKCEKKIQRTGGIASRAMYKRRALLDDCDYNMHLSNSCYAKSADHSISGWMWINIPIFFEAGGYSALGGTHYTFIREIPILSEYTTETRVVGWGEKWYYLVTEFVIYPKKSAKKIRSRTPQPRSPVRPAPLPLADGDGDGDESSASDTNTPPDVAMPGTNTHTPSRRHSISPPHIAASDVSALALASLRTPGPRTDGGVVAGLAVHEFCMKIGRITVPPRVGFHLAGHASLPAAKAHASALGSDKKAAAAWLAGGWKTDAIAGDIGRDILPCMSTLAASAILDDGSDMAEADDSSAQLAGDQNERAVKGMEAVSIGLGETVRL